MKQVLLIGAGNMGFAMLRAWAANKVYRFAVVEVNDSFRQRAESVGAQAYDSVSDLKVGFTADVVVIATKPQSVADAVAACGAVLGRDGLLMSVAAGVTIDAMRCSAGGGPVIVRCMPNMPAAIGEGMIVCCPSANARPSDRELALNLLSPIGRVAFIEDEGLMDAVTAMSGSGPAYVFHLLEAFSAAGISAGLPPDLAVTLAKQTVFGAAKLALGPEADPALLRQQVTSPNGTTVAALTLLMNPVDGLTVLFRRAVGAAQQRSRELGAE